MTIRNFTPIIGVLSAISVILTAGCSEKTNQTERNIEANGMEIPASSFESGIVRVKVSEALSAELEKNPEAAAVTIAGKVPALKVTKVERAFPYAGVFEPRTRKAGLHLWYNVYFDEENTITKANEGLSRVEGINAVEYRPKIIRKTGRAVIRDISGLTPAAQDGLPFNDPLLPTQWHYYNDGSEPNSISGSDINVVPVWEKGITGNADVIVAVVDGGVDYTHEDLADNMWHNPEKSGDEQYGYNFVPGYTGYKITPDDHGTHVAGTIAAVNNNGKGVCGIAGGDAERNVPGVKIMSCQIFEWLFSGDAAAAIKWAADHGAVISQNSWGYEAGLSYVPQSDKDAIDYFVKYAGYDENGVQTGPLAGGIVIFAAGNDDLPEGKPGEYESAVAVTALSSDYVRSYYSNYGDWADIAAPGGDKYKDAYVISTLPGNQYGEMQGTSMACPHVSGAAALLVSYLGGPGFTNEDLKARLLEYTTPIDSYNPGYEGLLGSGLLNIASSLSVTVGSAPEQITDLEASSVSNAVKISFTLPEDPDGEAPSSARIYYSTEPVTAENMYSANTYNINTAEYRSGETVRDSIIGLQFSTQYYIAATARDNRGNSSELSENVCVTTGENTPPVIEAVDGTFLSLKMNGRGSLMFKVSDRDGHQMSASVTSDTDRAVASMPAPDSVKVEIDATGAEEGDYKAVLTVTDSYGSSSSLTIDYHVAGNTAPRLVKEIEDILFDPGHTEPATIDLFKYFIDDEGHSMGNVSIEASKKGIAETEYGEGIITVSPLSVGVTDITVTVSDILQASTSTSFSVIVRDREDGVDIYPNPVTDTLYVRGSKEMYAIIKIISPRGAEIYNSRHAISPFSPAALDMTGAGAGTYTVTVKYGNTELKRNIIKL